MFRKHPPIQLGINKCLESLKAKVINDYDIPISIKELDAKCENSQFFKDVYNKLQKGLKYQRIKYRALITPSNTRKTMFPQFYANIMIHYLQDIKVLVGCILH